MSRITRRQAIQAGATSAFAFNFSPSRVFGANARMAVAGIGAGGKGTAEEKFAAMEEAGMTIARNPAEMGKAVQGLMG